MSGSKGNRGFSATPMPFPLDASKGTRQSTAPVLSSPSSNQLPAWFQASGIPGAGGGLKPLGNNNNPPSTITTTTETALNMSPRGKHKYPPTRPWSCHHIAAWLALVIAFIALTLTCILYFPGKHHGHTDTDIDRRGSGSEEQPHENYVAFRFEAESGPTRWPKTGVIAGLRLEDIVATRLCCVVGSKEYLVCDSSQGLTSNLGIAFVVRNVEEEHGAHLLIAAPSSDMSEAQCIFSWQTRIHEHDKASLVVAKGTKAGPGPAKSRFAHVHAGRRFIG